MKSRTSQIIILILIGIALIGGTGYAIWKASSRGTRSITITERNNIRINKTIQGEVTDVMANANIITVKDVSGQEIHMAIVPETRIVDMANNATDVTGIQKGFTVEGRGESVATDAMLASEIRITAIPEMIVFAPAKNTAVTSPLTLEGMAKGNWYFEANLPVEIVDAQRRSLGKKFVTATKDWMSESLVPFAGELEFQKPTTKTGFLIFKNDNPSGLEENEKSFEVLVDFEPTTMTVKAFYNNSKLDPAFLCDKVFPVSREIPWTVGTGRAATEGNPEQSRRAIEELLKGPSEQERAMNYFTNINPNVRINDVTIDNGTARIDFSDELGKNIAGSCRVTAIRAQITGTLEQFPSVKNVVISINGRVDDILQP
jgi:hypothetical protein